MDQLEHPESEEARRPYMAPVLTTLGSFEQLTRSKPGTKPDGVGGSTKAGSS
jgi:hypothetical protein